MSPTDVRNWLQNEGFRAKLDESVPEYASITTGVDGIPFDIDFYRTVPADGDLDNFESIVFVAGAEMDELPSLLKMNELNGRYKYLKAYADDNIIMIRMEQIAFPETLNERLFEEIFYTWSAIMPDFMKIAD